MDIIDSVSYDQYNDIPVLDELGINTKIIFNEETYKKILLMLAKTKKNNIETGAYFVGRRSNEDSMTIYIDYCTSEFAPSSGYISGGAVEPTDQNYRELNNRISELRLNGEKPLVFHYHTHPKFLLYESFSDQDLSIYAKAQLDNPNVNNYGMLGFPSPIGNNTYSLCIVQPVNPHMNGEVATADFYMFQNIYYCMNNEIYKMGQFDKNYTGRKFRDSNRRNLNIVRNASNNTNKAKVCGIGLDPNTGRKISDECVGYIDINNTMCFPKENLAFTFPSRTPKR